MSIDELYSKRISLLIKSADRENRNCPIHVTMEFQTHMNPVYKKELVMRLTDETDLFFLYTLRLGEDDFHCLKSQQGLLVDFQSFPQKVVDLLNMCLQEQHKELPKFLLKLEANSIGAGEISSAVLSIVETNAFKHLTHLALKFLPATDSDIKKHLANCLQQMKESNHLIQQRLEFTDRDLNHQLKQTQEALSISTLDLERLKSEWSAKITEVNAKHHEQLNFEREKALSKMAETQQRFESERRDLESAHMNIIKNSESRLRELESSNKSLTDKRYKGDSEVHELRSRLTLLEDETSRYKQEIQSLRAENCNLESERHRQEKMIESQKLNLATLEQEARESQHALTRSVEQMDTQSAYKKKLEDDFENKQREANRLEGKVKMMGEELKKGNDIIRKLQTEIKNYHSKVKLRTHIATEQEKLISDKDEELEKLKQEMHKTKSDLTSTSDENKKLSENLESTVKKLEESRQILKTNENVIQWLNKQLNETQSQPTSQNHDHSSNSANRIAYNAANNTNSMSQSRSYVSGIPEPRHYRPTQSHYNASTNAAQLTTATRGMSLSSSHQVNAPTSAQSQNVNTMSNISRELSGVPLVEQRYLQKHTPSPQTSPHTNDTVPARKVQSNQPPSKMTYQPITQPKTNQPRMPSVPLESAYFPSQGKLS